jgi:uncharacterized protein
MEFKEFTDVQTYRDKVKNFLEQEEVVNNLPLGILQNLLKPKKSQTQNYDEKPLLSLVEDEGTIILVLIMTPPYNLYVYGEGTKLEDAIFFAVNKLASHYTELPGVIGPKDVADFFADAWAKEKGVEPVIGMNQRIYQLTEVKNDEYSSGKLRLASQNDIALLTDWIHEFSKVTFGDLTEEDCFKRAVRMVEQETAYVWEDGDQVVSMANKTRPTANGITVSFVYTPPVHQRKGYASSCVAALSQLLLDDGYKYCTLYTDLDNPTSNSIYMKIGYEPIRDSVMYTFTKK